MQNLTFIFYWFFSKNLVFYKTRLEIIFACPSEWSSFSADHLPCEKDKKHKYSKKF